MDSIETIILKNIEVQCNGIIRNEKGRLIARLVDDIEYESEHVKGLSENTINPDNLKEGDRVVVEIEAVVSHFADGENTPALLFFGTSEEKEIREYLKDFKVLRKLSKTITIQGKEYDEEAIKKLVKPI